MPNAEDIISGKVTLEQLEKKIRSKGKSCRCKRG